MYITNTTDGVTKDGVGVAKAAAAAVGADFKYQSLDSLAI